MRHLELADIAKLLSDGGVFAEFCRHLAEVCPLCAERLTKVEALMKRFRHWDAETVVREGPAADELFEALLEKEQGHSGWSSLVMDVLEKAEYQTWGVAWVSLEKAQGLILEEDTKAQARELALLAATIAGYLGASYHPDSIADLKALAHATVAAAGVPGADSFDTLRQVAATVTALDQGTGDPTVARDVMDLLSQVFPKVAKPG
ncbi:MAG TPA: hypothetical protein VH988_01460 [Thermoanaerobaculia bacterium]|jgi:hypothetical protein|nr:hypothetical protein [Thermoanaerobaculia bacterium]